MPMVALTEAVRDRIRTFLGMSGDEADVTVARSTDGRPHPNSGQIFYGIVPGNERNEQIEYIGSRLDFKVIITLKASYVPTDRQEEELLYKAADTGNANTGGLWLRARAIKRDLHRNYVMMNAANVMMGGNANLRGFVEPSLFRSINYLGEKGPDWFYAEDYDPDGDAPCGVAIEVVFDRCLFVEAL